MSQPDTQMPATPSEAELPYTPYEPSSDFLYQGEHEASATTVRVFDFASGSLEESVPTSLDDIAAHLGSDALTWIDWVGLKDAKLLQRLCERLGLHPLHIEDLLHIDQHPRVEDEEDYTLVFLRKLYRPSKDDELQSDQIAFIITDQELITIRESSDHDLFLPVQSRLRNSRGRIRNMGPDYLAYSLLDAIIDGYFAILADLEDRIEDVQDEILAKPDPDLMINMHRIRSDLLIARKSLWPLREAVLALERSPAIGTETELFMRNAYDHTIKLADSLDFTRDLLNAAMESYMTVMSNRMNETMRLLTVISLIFMPLTFISGVYGMNFRHMPELEWVYGYPTFWIVIVLIASGMIYFFHKRKWL